MSLTIAGTSIKVAALQEQPSYHVGGGYVRAADGTPVDQSRGVKRVWQVTTIPLDNAEYTSVRTLVNNRAAQTIGGTFVPITSGYTNFIGTRYLPGSGILVAIRFDLLEA